MQADERVVLFNTGSGVKYLRVFGVSLDARLCRRMCGNGSAFPALERKTGTAALQLN